GSARGAAACLLRRLAARAAGAGDLPGFARAGRQARGRRRVRAGRRGGAAARARAGGRPADPRRRALAGAWRGGGLRALRSARPVPARASAGGRSVVSAPAFAALDGDTARPLDALAFQRAALAPAQTVVVEACAGAGKTWLLV